MKPESEEALNLSELSNSTIYIVRGGGDPKVFQFFYSGLLPYSLSTYFRDHPEIEAIKKLRSKARPLAQLKYEALEDLKPLPILDFETSVTNIEETETLRDLLGVNHIVNEVFKEEATLVCSSDDSPLEPYDQKSLFQDFYEGEIKPDIVALGYKISFNNDSIFNSSKKDSILQPLLWQFREARSLGFRRFIIDGRYVQLERFQPQESIEETNLVQVSKEEEALLSGALEIILIERTLPNTISDLIEFQSLLREARVEGLLSNRKGLVAVGLKAEKKNQKEKIFSLIMSVELHSNYKCSFCNRHFFIEDLDRDQNLPKEVAYKLRGHTKEDLLKKPLNEILFNIFSKISKETLNTNLKERLRYFNSCLKDSFILDKDDHEFSTLSYSEKAATFLKALVLNGVSNVFYLLKLSQSFEECSSKFLTEFLSDLERARINGISFFYFSDYDFSAYLKKVEIITYQEGELRRVKKDRSLMQEELAGSLSLNLEEIDNAFKKEKIICVSGPVASGKTNLLLDYCLEAVSKQKKKRGVKTSYHYFSFKNQGIQYLSDQPHKNFSDFLNPNSNIVDLLGVKETILALYAGSQKAKNLNLYKDDFLKPENSVHRCVGCEGNGRVFTTAAFNFSLSSLCPKCLGTGLSEIAEQLSIFELSYGTLFQSTLGSIFETFLGEEKVKNVYDVINSMSQRIRDDINSYKRKSSEQRAYEALTPLINTLELKFSAKLFELSPEQQIFTLITVVCLAQKGDFCDQGRLTYAFEHPFGTFFKQKNLILESLKRLLSNSDTKFLYSDYSALRVSAEPFGHSLRS